ncbi:hypothetical protein WR25_12770 isoform C [Diploscapter pachys]|nr:hypothetical protein WR25_12770 isoform C [Diploscapter pachys]
MPEGTMLFPGSAKCATFIEGPKGRKNGNMALIVDASKTPFHVSEPLLDKYRNIFSGDQKLANFAANAGSFSHVVEGLFVQTTHLGPRKLFKIIDVVPDKTASETTFEYNGSPISVAVYFQHRYNIALHQTDLPLVRCKGPNLRDEVFLPAELCVIAPNQRVTIQQQTPRLMRDAIKICAMPPKQRQIDTRKSMNAMHLTNPENPFINALGVRLVNDPLTVAGRQLDYPTMIYAVDVTHAREGKWRGTAGGYVQGGQVGIWAMYFIASKTDRSANTEKCYAFGRSFVQNCKRRGIQVEDPEFVGFLQLDERDVEEQVAALEDMFSKARSHKCEFLFTVTSDKLPTHKTIKFLERKYQIPNQDLKMSTCNRIAENVKSGQTIENVINKFNVKLGGHNYNLHTTHIHSPKEYLKQERIIAGIAQSAVEGRNRETKEQRTVFGFAANSSLNPQEFVGGFRYHKDTEKATAVKAIIAHIIKQYEASHQGQHPSEVVIYWNGQAEGEMSKVLGEVVHGGLQQAFAQLPRAPQWTFIMAVKRQNNIRIFKTDINPEDRPSKQNIPAGVVVDSQLTDPVKKQFFLNSHTTLQGSAATPCYTVLHDELNLSMDALETMTFGLAHLHQICSMTTSLPTPLYVATEYTKRGACLLQEKVKMSGDAPEDELTIELGYADTVMADRRINA